MRVKKFAILLLALFAVSTMAATAASVGGPPKLPQKSKYKIGFSQTESNNPWRLAETKSFKTEAKRLGYQLVITDAGGDAAKQVADVQSMISQRVDAIFLAPREEKPLVPAIKAAKGAGIPVFLVDRNVDQKLAKSTVDYVTFLGSDFVRQGQRAAQWLAKATHGKAKIIELEGTVGSSPAIDRKKGFDKEIKRHPGMKILVSQSGDFNRQMGRQVTETLLQSHPDVTAIYAHNDEMAIGAIAALKAAGKKPGKTVTLVSIDGERDALKAIIRGELGASVESSPFFGPVSLATMKKYAAGAKLPPWVVVKDRFFDKSNAKKSLSTSY